MTTTTEPQPQAEPAKDPAPVFDSREERENYYRWVYCVKHGITDMESYGVKPLNLPGSHASPVTASPAAASRGRKPGNTIDLELTPAFISALRAANATASFTGKALRTFWNLCALFTAVMLASILLGVLTA